MTDREAIEILKFDGCTDCTRQPTSAYFCDCEGCTYKEALHIAVKALKVKASLNVETESEANNNI